MTTDIIPQVNKEIESKNIEVGEWGLTFKGQLTIQEWYDTALTIQKFDGKMQWYLGDLAVYAESPVTGWGESKYADLVAATGYSPESLSNMARVARRFPISFREKMPLRNGISFNHFAVVVKLEDAFAEYWLKKAAENGWGVAKLREEINKDKEAPEKEEKPIGYTSFAEKTKEFFRGYVPNLSQEEYDEESWLLEIHDVITGRLHDLGIEL